MSKVEVDSKEETWEKQKNNYEKVKEDKSNMKDLSSNRFTHLREGGAIEKKDEEEAHLEKK